MSDKDLKALDDNDLNDVTGGASCGCHPSTGPCPLHRDNPKPGDMPGPLNTGPGSTVSVTDTVYTVKKGDTLGGIAATFGTTLAKLKEWNNITNPDKINVGQKLIVKRI